MDGCKEQFKRGAVMDLATTSAAFTAKVASWTTAQVSGGGCPKTNRDTPTFKPLPKHRVWWKSNLFAWFAST